ncbi:hypothetical protein VULLAG_LOCUS9203 [Vulpes lagopus]
MAEILPAERSALAGRLFDAHQVHVAESPPRTPVRTCLRPRRSGQWVSITLIPGGEPGIRLKKHIYLLRSFSAEISPLRHRGAAPQPSRDASPARTPSTSTSTGPSVGPGLGLGLQVGKFFKTLVIIRHLISKKGSPHAVLALRSSDPATQGNVLGAACRPRPCSRQRGKQSVTWGALWPHHDL